jgi:hypothetical protein
LEKKTALVIFKYLSRSQSNVSPLTTTLFPSWFVDILFKDDVTVILLLGVAFVVAEVGVRDGSMSGEVCRVRTL